MLETFDTLRDAETEAERMRIRDWPDAVARPLELETGDRMDTGRFVVVLVPGYHTPGARCAGVRHDDGVCQFVPSLVAMDDGRLVYLN